MNNRAQACAFGKVHKILQRKGEVDRGVELDANSAVRREFCVFVLFNFLVIVVSLAVLALLGGAISLMHCETSQYLRVE